MITSHDLTHFGAEHHPLEWIGEEGEVTQEHPLTSVVYEEALPYEVVEHQVHEREEGQ